MKLYHYTSLEALDKIIEDGEIKLTASNLLRPINPRIVNGVCVDETDSYKPVVWFSSLLDFGKAHLNGLTGSSIDKTQAAIQIETGILMFHKWDEWAKRNHIENEWFNSLKATAPLWQTFYISESPVKITPTTGIIIRPDILKQLQGNNS